jgi:protein TonB
LLASVAFHGALVVVLRGSAPGPAAGDAGEVAHEVQWAEPMAEPEDASAEEATPRDEALPPPLEPLAFDDVQPAPPQDAPPDVTAEEAPSDDALPLDSPFDALPSAPREFAESRLVGLRVRRPSDHSATSGPAAAVPVASAPPAAPAPADRPGGGSHGVLVRPVPDPLNREPSFPAEAAARGERGVVVLRIEVAIDGSVTAVSVVQSSGFPMLDDAASRAAHAWRFRPALRDGEPVPAIVRQTVRFE